MSDDHPDEFANLRAKLKSGLAEDGRVSGPLDRVTASVLQLQGAGVAASVVGIGSALTKHRKK